MSEDKTQIYDDKIIEGYEYDGITEYDNPCPVWLMYIFYFTVLLAVFYTGYHFGSSSRDGILDDYVIKLNEAHTPAQSSKQKPEISENELSALLQDADALAEGKEIFGDKCALCHGNSGQGLIGPNLIDNCWLRGKGKISDIAVTIRSGIPDKGMIAWENRIPEQQILHIAAYIKSIQGTTAENAKEPDGELVEE
ncbi:MAG: c-type cytochrome [Candidatus Scalindua rubra]|uniref:Cbb3-type cytochrome c oxidase subunit CcoP n=1 Tax=Candidatus Scalindua brodae TaxID=237368 RepID=A0A0B0EIN4_9BACT|nr:MAG: cbb3-type cytochrome c oxidase subunit CcoP [Candidatus Scalindua brodae]MBZ0109130.1 c-type cytochrome [Candidatus Scalindua rubra]TWU33567.1 Cbb3-type cytochrome c oxidase subunit CcoP2 [Candidatus Brocadiaceae bacterium S225]